MSDISITAANVKASSLARFETIIAGATLTRGQPYYKDASDNNRAKPADADAEASAEVQGICYADLAAGQAGLGITEDPDLEIGGTTVAGTPYCASPTAGGICLFSDLGTGDFVTALGVGKADNKLHFQRLVSGETKPA